MARKSRKIQGNPTAPLPLTTSPAAEPEKPVSPRPTRWLVWAGVMVLLGIHYTLAARSLVLENPTVDEVAHMPAGVTYWQRGTFRLYHHNPPLVKLISSLPVVLSHPDTERIYQQQSWIGESPSQANVGQNFALFNADRYFELFDLARLTIPFFSMIGGVFIFLWSRKLHGTVGGFVSLILWCFCPNILAHGRLVTSDVAAAVMALTATYVFWRFLKAPGWGWAVASGILLGLAQLTKFSLLLLYGYWPLLWLVRTVAEGRQGLQIRKLVRDSGFGVFIVGLSVVVINAGYFFERVGEPLGSFEFCSRSLTRSITPGVKPRPRSRNDLLDRAWQYRENRFRGTLLASLPVPLPYHYVAGFDEQKIESEGLPLRWFDPSASENEITGYSVYLDGQMKKTGWWYYYLATLAYKVPEGTWLLVLASMILLVRVRGPQSWFDELAVMLLPVMVLFAMSVLTDINLGLRYILPVLPFLYVGAGRAGAWVESLQPVIKTAGRAWIGLSLAATVVSVLLVHPHYLAYFNQVSGGPSNGARHLIDSNLDWGQDLVGLRRWVEKNHPGKKVGLVYFGQISPHIFELRGEPFEWFLPPFLPGTTRAMYESQALVGPRRLLTPGLYAISASVVKGLPWRFYDPGLPPQATWSAAWNAGQGAYAYFDQLVPIAKVGYSIYVYDLSESDCARLNRLFAAPATSS